MNESTHSDRKKWYFSLLKPNVESWELRCPSTGMRWFVHWNQTICWAHVNRFYSPYKITENIRLSNNILCPFEYLKTFETSSLFLKEHEQIIPKASVHIIYIFPSTTSHLPAAYFYRPSEDLGLTPPGCSSATRVDPAKSCEEFSALPGKPLLFLYIPESPPNPSNPEGIFPSSP